jgi:hypothetical protein
VLHHALARQGLGIAITAASDLSTADATNLTIRRFDPPLTLTKALIWQRHNNSRVLAAFLTLWISSRLPPTGKRTSTSTTTSRRHRSFTQNARAAIRSVCSQALTVLP